MGAVGGMLGLSGGASGTGFAGPSGGPVDPITNLGQTHSAYMQSGYSMDAQNELLKALQGQQGLQNQSNVYNQMQGIASGQGPNPAQAQYQQNIQNLAAQQAGQLASIKGISPAVQARLIAQQGGQAMQNAAGQGAANLANQQLNAMNASGALATNMAGNQMQQTNANVASRQNEQQMLYNTALGTSGQNVQMQSNVNSANTALAGQQMQGQQKIIGGIGNAAGSVLGLAQGGEVPGPKSKFAQHLACGGMAHDYRSGGNVVAKNSKEKAVKSGNSYANDKIPAVLSEGEVVIPRSVMQSKNPSEGAAKFIQAVLAKKKGKK